MSALSNVIPIFGDRMRRVVRSDGWQNLVTGLGTSRDKSTFNLFARDATLSSEQLDALYSNNDIAATICDVVPNEELRKGFDVVIAPDVKDVNGNAIKEAASASQDVVDAAKRINLAGKMTEARVWGRCFGGGVMILGVDDGATMENQGLVQPLDESRIASFDHINVVDRRFAHPVRFYSDPTSPKFGLPEVYLITPQAIDSFASARLSAGSMEIHETRLIVFGGVRTTIRTRQENGGWDMPALQRVHLVLQQFGVSWDSLSHMLQDASQGVFKMQGFLEALGANETSLIMERLDLMDMSRSIVRALVLDSDGESFERQNFTWTGIKEPFELQMLRLAAAARMPVTILMGQSPAGMNATGASDIRWFYDTIETSQTNFVEPALRYALRLLMLSKSGPTGGQLPESWSITFPPLWQETPNEQASTRKLTAEADAIYIDRGVVIPEEIAVSRFTPDGWKPDTTINLEERQAVLEADIEADIADTPTLDPDEMEGDVVPESDNVQRQALAGGQTAQLIEIAKLVQSGELDQASAVAIVLASNPSLEEAQAVVIVGEVDEEKMERNRALTAQLTGGNTDEDEDDDDDDDDDTGHDEDEDDPETQLNQDTIRKTSEGEYELVSDDGKVLGTHKTRAEAAAQEKAIRESQRGR